MKRLTTLLLSLILVSTTVSAQLKSGDYEWFNSLRTDHPRLFFTEEEIPQIVNNSMLFDARTYNVMQKRIDRVIKKGVEFKDDQTKEFGANSQFGYRAAEAAMLWVITKDVKYLDFAKQLLDMVIDYYDMRISNNRNVGSNSLTVIATLCAYDWIYNDLTAEERADLGKRLYKATYDIAWHGPDVRSKRPRENTSSPTSNFHGTAVLPWYVGLTFYGEGVADSECNTMLRNGYDLHQKMSAHRAKWLGNNGGIDSGTISNGFGTYPYAEYDFIYTFRSATGIDIAPQMSYMLGYLKYLDWARLPGNREFGLGHSLHSNNKLPRHIVSHIKEIGNLMVKSKPEIFNWCSSLLLRYNDTNGRTVAMPFLPLLHRFHFESDEVEYVADEADKQSMYFESLGHIIMRSGVGDKDTYAVFSTARKDRNRQHFDINNCVIYKNGYRALDSGTSPQPGLHLSHYYCRTVAHNCVTIQMPDERMPRYSVKAAHNEDPDTPIPNDGGQCNNRKGRLLTHKESVDYVYIASDATECYHQSKADKVVREFVWVKPDIFIVYDRVVSDKAEYPKRWLYHTVSEPVMSGKAEFAEVSQGGKSICRTLLPKGAVVARIGGEGKQFWSDGKNWAIPEYKKEDPLYKRNRNLPRNNHPLVGQWRVEVSPKKAATHDNFLHIIQVGDESLQSLPKTECKEGKEVVSLAFEYAGKSYSLSFDKTKKYGCKIKVTK